MLEKSRSNTNTCKIRIQTADADSIKSWTEPLARLTLEDKKLNLRRNNIVL